MNREKAQRLVEEELALISTNQGAAAFAVMEHETIEKTWGWVFFYQNKSYIESGNDAEMLAGNAPIIVNRYTGELSHTGTAYDLEHYLQEYEAGLSGTT